MNYCTRPAQCWYDNVVYSPPGKPDVVYLGGSYELQQRTDSATTAVLPPLDRRRGRVHGHDVGRDDEPDASGYLLPAELDRAERPAPRLARGRRAPRYGRRDLRRGRRAHSFERAFTDISSQCASRGLRATSLALCQQLLSAVPTHLYSLNKGLSTLQFQSLSVAPDDPNHLQGGTQDNGTFEASLGAGVWPQDIYGDGGQSGFSADQLVAAVQLVHLEQSTMRTSRTATRRSGSSSRADRGQPGGRALLRADHRRPESGAAGTIFEGSQSVWRTQDWAGDQAFLEANCPEFTTSGT